MSGIDEGYFQRSFEFFHRVRWMYNTPMTEILVRKTLDGFPDEWLEILEKLENDELNNLVAKIEYKHNWPPSLISFLKECRELDRLPKLKIELTPRLPVNFLRGLTPKKQHEISQLTDLVHRHCFRENISTVVDFGSGLGYISQLLNYTHGYRVLGLESNPENVITARKRQNDLYPESIDSVEHFEFQVTSNSSGIILSKLEEFLDSEKEICMIGLHTCGDLSVSIFEIFTELEVAKLLILISCCYHKLSIEEVGDIVGGKEFFKFFPLSQTFKNIIQESNYCPGDFLRRTFLRLACQEPSNRWERMSKLSHDNHAFHVLARAVLQLYVSKNRIQLKKLVRNATRKSQCQNFRMYVKDALRRYTLKNIEGKDSLKNIENDLMSLWNENEQNLRTVELYTGLQLLLQIPAESLILTDRVSWLQERGFRAEIVQVMETALSPRSNAIVSRKCT